MIFKLTNINYKTYLNKPLLISICRDTWLGTSDSGRRTMLYRILVKNHIITFPIANMIIETVYDKQGSVVWEAQSLNAARTGYVAFLKMAVFSKQQ